jgi:UDP-N-acetylmuramate--L-alanine ligase/UDP-N-acetylenolpyruvoylglucosamine reductase
MSSKKSIAITGMHGKTSTTGMISKILLESFIDPTIAVGGTFAFIDGNAKYGKGAWAVFEADESDGTLLAYHPRMAVITNLEPEHVNYFKNLDDVLAHFRKFLSQVEDLVILNGDDPGCQALMRFFPQHRFLTYGFSEDVQLRAVNIKTQAWRSHFEVLYAGQNIGLFQLNVTGLHQISNALAAIGVGLSLGLDPQVMAQALSHFEGAQRRFQIRGKFKDTVFVDDYAHHPTEIRSTLEAARLCFQGRLLGIFQPHRYSRTLYFKKEFAQVLSHFDHVVITDIYPSDEKAIPGVSGRLIYEQMIGQGWAHVDYVSNLKELKEYVIKNFSKYESILTLGAGNITQLLGGVLSELESNASELNFIRGKIVKNEKMSRHTTFRLGGPADLWVEPVDLEDLVHIQKWAYSKGLPIFVIGNGSNVIVRDGGIRGIVVRLSNPSFRKYEFDGEFLTVGTGMSLAEVIQLSLDSGLAGLENLKGIPGTIGGALHFNAGAYGLEIGERVHSVLVLNPDGSLETLSAQRLQFQYRMSLGLKGKIAIKARFHLSFSDARKIYEKVIKLKEERAQRYPKLPNAGCIFKNPKEGYAGQLIDEIGLKNLTVGGAQISSQHANFIVNTGRAKASEVITLIDEVRKKVYEERNVLLENEVEVIGED